MDEIKLSSFESEEKAAVSADNAEAMSAGADDTSKADAPIVEDEGMKVVFLDKTQSIHVPDEADDVKIAEPSSKVKEAEEATREEAAPEVSIPQAELERIAEPAPAQVKEEPAPVEEKLSRKERKKLREEEEAEEEDDYYYDEPRRGGVAKVLIVSFLLLFLFSAIAFSGYVVYHVYFYSQVYDGVWVDGVDYSGLTKREVLAALTEKYNGVPAGENLEITMGSKTYVFEIAGNISYDCRSTAEKIILYGRQGSFSQRVQDIIEAMRFGYEIELAYSITDSGVETQIQRAASVVEQDMVQSSYSYAGGKLLVDRGQVGLTLDQTRLLTFIKNRLYSGDFSPAIFELQETHANALDLNAIKAAVDQELRQPTLDLKTDPTGNTVLPGIKGIYLDIDVAEKVLADAGEQRVVELPLRTVMPDYTDDEYMEYVFSYELARIDTPLTSNANRTTNVTLAASFCNGVILMPGDTFSFNGSVGPRTTARGFKEATVYNGSSAEDGLGGGICQVSSAIYYCALRADMDIVERYAHSRMVTYTPLGQDATVAWGSKDFKFKNNSQWPVKIVTVYDTASNQVDVSLVGTNTDFSKTVEIVSEITSKTPFRITYKGDEAIAYGQQQQAGGYTGYKATSYRVEYVDGVEVSRTKVANSTYYKYDRVYLVAIDDPRAGTTVDAEWQPDDPYQYQEESVFEPAVTKPTPTTVPGQKDEPQAPDTPDTPDTPDVPDTPDTPDVPVTPDIPITPDTPDEPSGTTCTEHSWGVPQVTKEATCRDRGEATITCEVCGYSMISYIQISNVHSWHVSNGISTCSVCGTVADTPSTPSDIG